MDEMELAKQRAEDVVLTIIGKYKILEEGMQKCLEEASEESLAKYATYLSEYLDIDGYNIRDTIAANMYELGLSPAILEKKFCLLSEGEKTQILIMALMLKPNHFLLIDEPTNHLDARARQYLAKYLEGQQGFIVVSHDRMFLDKCIDHVISINTKTITVCAGNYSSWKTNFDLKNRYNQEKNTSLKKASEQFLNAAKNFEEWTANASDKSAKKFSARKQNMEHRSQVAESERKQLVIETEYAPKLKFNFEKSKYNDLLMLQKAQIDYGEGTFFSDVSFSLTQGKRIALVGPNGCGKTSLLKGIMGINAISGYISKAPDIQISYLSQIEPDEFETIDDLLDKNALDDKIYHTVLSQLGFQPKDFSSKISELSMGQRKKVYIAKSLSEKANLYIWDEPLNYLDVSCREQLEEAIVSFDVPMILVEHDAKFIQNIGAEIYSI